MLSLPEQLTASRHSDLCKPTLWLPKHNQGCYSAALLPPAISLASRWHNSCLAMWWSRLGSWSSWELAWDLAARGYYYLWEDHPAYGTSRQQRARAAQQMEGRPVGSHSGAANFLLSKLLGDSVVNKELQWDPWHFWTLQIKRLEAHRAQNLLKQPMIKSSTRDLGMRAGRQLIFLKHGVSYLYSLISSAICFPQHCR